MKQVIKYGSKLRFFLIHQLVKNTVKFLNLSVKGMKKKLLDYHADMPLVLVILEKFIFYTEAGKT